MTDAPTTTARARLSVRIGSRALARLQTIATDEGVRLTDVVRVALAVALEHHAAEIRTRLRNIPDPGPMTNQRLHQMTVGDLAAHAQVLDTLLATIANADSSRPFPELERLKREAAAYRKSLAPSPVR